MCSIHIMPGAFLQSSMPQEVPYCHQQLLGGRSCPVWYPKIICATGQGCVRTCFPWASGRTASFWGSSWRVNKVPSNVWEAQGNWVLAHELPSRWVNVCSLQKKWGVSKFHPITEFQNPTHASYTDTEREGHSTGVLQYLHGLKHQMRSLLPHPHQRAGPTWEKLCVYPADKLYFDSIFWGQFCLSFLTAFFFFPWCNSTGSGRIYSVLSQKAKLISPSNILGFAPDEQLV